MSGERRVLMPVDGSENSTHAFKFYLDNVRQDRDCVVFVHCLEPPSLPIFTFRGGAKFPFEDWAAMISRNIVKGEELENNYRIDCQSNGIKNEFHMISSKKPSEGVCHAIKEFKADIVVMGSRGLSKIDRAFLGSVSTYILHHTNIGVFIVPQLLEGQDSK